MKSYHHDCQNAKQARMLPMNTTNWIENNPQALKPTQRTIGHRVKLGIEEVVFLREEHNNLLFSAKQSSLKTYIQISLYRLNRLYLGMCSVP